jgi:hypothetical protein
MDRTGKHEKELRDPLARELAPGGVHRAQRKASLHACLLAALECSSAGHNSSVPHGCAVARINKASVGASHNIWRSAGKYWGLSNMPTPA